MRPHRRRRTNLCYGGTPSFLVHTKSPYVVTGSPHVHLKCSFLLKIYLASQIRSHDFWRYIKFCVCMYVSCPIHVLGPPVQWRRQDFCNRGEVRYASIGVLEYEVPQSRLYCLCINVALCSTAFVVWYEEGTMKAHTYYIIFGRPPIGGSFLLSPWRRHCSRVYAPIGISIGLSVFAGLML